MTKISTYVVDEKVTALDKWIGSDANMQNRTKNFTPKKLASYFNDDQVINIGIPLQYKYYTLDPLEQRPNGTLTFETEIGPAVNFSSVTTFLLSKYTTKQNIVSDFLNFLEGSKVLLFKSKDINSFGFYRISSIEPYEENLNFFVVTVTYETGNGALEEDEDYMISLVSLADSFIPTKTSELINDGDDGVNPFTSELDINRTEWDAAYDDKINSAEVSGDAIKTLTLTKQDGGVIEASWTDNNTDTVISVFGRDGDIVAETGDYTTDQVTEVVNKKYQTDDQDLFNDATSSIQAQLNSKEPNISVGTISQYYRGDKTFQTLNTSEVPEGSNLYITNSRVISSELTGYAPASGEVTSSDSILTAIEKLSGNITSEYIPYTGATKDVDLGTHQLKADSIAISTVSAETVDVGEVVWNAIDGTFDMGLIGGVTLQAGQELHLYGKATEIILNGQAVMFAGVQGDHILIAKADAIAINANPEYLIGIATQGFANNQFGYVTVFGNVRGLNTTSYALGSILYYNSESSIDGLMTATEPTAPNAKIIVAAVVRVHATQGILLVRPHVMPKLKDIQDVYAPSPSSNNGLFWNSLTLRYENNSVIGALGYTPYNATNPSDYITLGSISSTAIGLTYTNTTGAFSLTNGYVIPTAAEESNWNYAYSNRITSASTPLSILSNSILISQAGSSTNGYLSLEDWNNFNSKQVAGNYITNLAGEATASGPGTASITLNNASVTAKILSGVNITGGTVVDTDTMLTAFGKLQNQINGLIGGSIYQGVWNAFANTPTLTSSTGTDGNYYIVNVAGSINLNGINDWKIGDWVIFHGGTWQKVDNTDAVSSVNGFTGAISLITDYVPEGTASLYFTEGRVNTNANVSANTAARHAAVTLGTANGLGLIGQEVSLGLSGSSGTGALSSANWNTFNNKQSALSGTGFVKISGTTISYDNTTYTSNLGTVTSVSGTGGYGGLTLSGTVTSSGNLSLSGTPTGTWPISVTGNAATATNADYANASGTSSTTSAVSGTTNYIPKFTSGSALGNSSIFDNGNVGIGTTSPIIGKLQINAVAGEETFLALNSSNTGSGCGNILFNENGTSRWNIGTTSDNSLQFYNQGVNSALYIRKSDSAATFASSVTASRFSLDGTNDLYFANASNNWSIKTSASENKLNFIDNQFGVTRLAFSANTSTFSSSVTVGTTDATSTINAGGGNTNLTLKAAGSQGSIIFMAGAVANGNVSTREVLQLNGTTGAATFSSSVTATSFINSTAPATNALLANGTTVALGSNAYNSTAYLPLSGNSLINGVSGGNVLTLKKSEAGASPTPVLRLENTGAFYTSRIVLTDGVTNDANISYLGATQSLGLGIGSSLNSMTLSSTGQATFSSSVTANGDMRSPIFYDSNNTGYYVDPAGTSVLNNLNVSGKITQTGPGRTATISTTNYDSKIGSSDLYLYTKSIEGGAYPVTMQVFRDSDAATLWPINLQPLGGGVNINTYSNLGYAFGISGTGYATTDFRAPIFYDSNDTAFYVDPASTSNLNTLVVNGGNGISVVRTGGGSDPYGVLSVSCPSGDNYSYISMTRNGVLAMSMGIDTSNNFWLGTSSGGFNGVRTGVFITVSTGGTLTAQGDVVAYSDKRVKENIQTIKNGLGKVLSLRGVTYNRNDSEDKAEKIGVIAQEIQEVLPQVVYEQADGMLGVSYGNITAVLIEAVKEQQTQIEELKQLVNQLINK